MVAMPRAATVFLIRRNLAAVLRVGLADRADRADAHAVEIGAGLGGVALKIAVQRAILLRDGEFVAGAGEMIHADVVVARAEKSFEARAEDPEFFLAFGEMRRNDPCCFLSQGTCA